MGIAMVGLTALTTGCQNPKADIVYYNGRIYTVNEDQPWAEAVAVKDGRYIHVGTTDEVLNIAERETTLIDLNGCTVLPGLCDSHIQPLRGQLMMIGLRCPDTEARDAILDAIRVYAESHPDLEWIAGGHYNESAFLPDGPTRHMLDEIFPDRPVYIEAAGGHSAWVNSAALAIAGITRDTKSPKDGIIETDPTGEPTGVLRERAMTLVSQHIPPYDYETQLAAAEDVVQQLNAYGITSVKTGEADRIRLKVLNQIDREGGLTLRVGASTNWRDPYAPELEAEREIILKDTLAWRSPHVHSEYVKIHVDGVPAGTAVMLEPYLDGSNGELLHTVRAFKAAVIRFDNLKRSVVMHAVGGGAVRLGLDAIAAARRANTRSYRRHQIAHCVYVSPDDLPRFKELDAICEFSPPLWMPSEAYPQTLEPWLDPSRLDRTYPVKDAFEAEAVVVFGSDWPEFPTANPWPAIQALVTRANPAGDPPGQFGPEHAIDLASAVKGYTINGAYAMHLEKEFGSIEVGKMADMIVVNQHIFDIPPEKIGDTRVWMTVFEGRRVYSWDGETPLPAVAGPLDKPLADFR
jgi:predicted amidohydrolase YtcJ